MKKTDDEGFDLSYRVIGEKEAFVKFETKIRYKEKYLPSKRHRVPRIREVEEMVTVELREVKKENAPVAMVVTDHKSYLDESGNRQAGFLDSTFYAIDGQLYTEKRDLWGNLDRGPYSLEQLSRDLMCCGDWRRTWKAGKQSKEDMLQSIEEFVRSRVMIDGVIYRRANEPRYVVVTFGLGHNHGGTSLFDDTKYNANLSKDSYFSALQRNEAIAYAKTVASRRGDTNSLEHIGKVNIKVLMPEMVRCDPQREHGDGNPFMNSIEGLVQGSGSAMEAGLLVMSATAAQISDEKLSLEDQIQTASSIAEQGRAAEAPQKEQGQVR